MELTDRKLKSIKPDDTRQEIPDGRVSGLYFVMQPSGKASWALRYRISDNTTAKRWITKKLTLGAYPALGISDARTAAFAAKDRIDVGIDPSTEKKAATEALKDVRDTVGALLDDFLSKYAAKQLKPATQREMKRIADIKIRKAWGDRKIKSIAKRDVIDLIDAVVEAGAEVYANRVLAFVRKFFNWLVERDVINVSPVNGVKAPTPERARSRVLTDNELRLLWKATEGNEPLKLATRILAFTGQRRAEVGEMRWSELDIDAKLWTIPGERVKNSETHTIPLAPAVLDILNSIPKQAGCDFVFTTNGETAISGWSHFKDRTHKKMEAAATGEAKERDPTAEALTMPEWRIHDLRRTCASGMARLGQPVHVVEKLLNHISGTFGGIVGVYQRHDFAKEKEAAANAWAAYVVDLVSGEPAKNVIRLAEARNG